MKFKWKSVFTLTMLIVIVCPNTQGQILERVLKRTKQKVQRKAEDMVVEKVSEEVSRRIYRSMSDAFDQMLFDAQQNDSIYRANYGDSVYLKSAEFTAAWMARMNTAVDLPESYQFSTRMDVKIVHEKEEQEMIMYLGEGIIGIESTENGERRIMLMDPERDAAVLYMEDNNGQCSAQAIPNTFSTAATFMNTSSEYDSTYNISIYKSNKTKKVAGFRCDEYLGADQQYNYKFYMSDEVNVDWRESFFGVLEKFGNYKSCEDIMELDGMMLESHSYSKTDKKDKTSWITQSIKETDFEIINSECEFGALYQ